MIAKKMTMEQVRRAGLEVLERHLGPDGLIRFMQQYEFGAGDYTKERHGWLRETSVESLTDKILDARKKP